MKKILIPIGALLLSGLAMAQNQSSTTENFVYTKTYLDYNGTTPTKTSETVQYFDGLGRPKQVVNIKASPQGKDVVTHIEYDGFGRQVKDYLPVPQQGTQNGAIYTSPLSNATQSNLYGSEKIFAEKILENSPLDRILQQKQVGTAWNDKPVQFGYDANTTADEVKKYVTVTTWVNGATSSQISQSTNYLAAQLYKNTVTDEDGNQTIEFKNGEGQVLLVRKMLSATEKADTYYVYNEYNQLAFVIPPLASVTTDPNTVISDLCYQYKYDGRNRLVEKKLPGKGWEYMVYDKQDRLVMTQDANLKENNQWLFTKYDQFSRPIYTGICYSGSSRIQLVEAVESFGPANESRATSSWNNSGMDVYYTKSGAYPNESNFSILTVNYYDNYPTYSFNPAFPTVILGADVLTDTPDANGLSTKSLPVMSLVKNIEDDNWTKNYTYYDKKGRTIGSYSINHLGGRTKVESKLDFAGVVQQSITRHKRLDTDTDRVITENFIYDSQNRLLTHTHQVDSGPTEYLAQNSYNELSQLSGKKVGGISPSVPLQDISYSYNIRGWMTKINDPANLNGKLFGYEIKYNNPENPSTAPARFNGNIAEIDWMTGTFPNGTKRRYSYQYDGLNRLLQGAYSEPGSSVTANNYYNEILSYDINGNIRTLKRFSTPSTGGTTAEKIDDLIYNYTGNRLDKITLPTGVVNNPSGYNALQSTISYDLNGNMIIHPDKGIVGITYNYLNLPSVVTNSSGRSSYKVNYLYRADGTKIRKSLNSFVQSKTDYLDGFQYLTSGSDVLCVGCPPPSPELQFVPTSEGYFDFVENKYIYNYVDHLGNVRVSYFNNGNGVEVLGENNYYPFGLRHEGYNDFDGNSAYQYKYNGKELQTESGMYDYGARFYMPDIGRWGVIDPRSQYTHEAYSYVWNNPISFNDPTGMQGEEVSDWITNGKGGYRWDPNVTGPENTPNGWKYVGPTGNYRVPGATVQLLEGGNKFTDIDEVATRGGSGINAAAITVGVGSSESGVGLFILFAVLSKLIIDDIFHNPWPIQHGIQIDPMMHSPQTMNSESDSSEDKDVNGQDVPKEQKGDGNGKPTRNERMQQKKAKNGDQGNNGDNEYNQSSEHTSGARGSTKQKHQNGQARKNRDQGGEKGDRNRRRYK
jgi:RHS repeat-associated protein